MPPGLAVAAGGNASASRVDASCEERTENERASACCCASCKQRLRLAMLAYIAHATSLCPMTS